MSGLSDYLAALNRQRGWSTRDIERETERHGHKISYATASRYLNGTHPARPSDATLRAFADAYGVDVNAVRAAASRPGIAEPLDLGSDGARLTGEQREAVRTIVRLFAAQNRPAPPADAPAVEDRAQPDGAMPPLPENIYGLAALEKERELDQVRAAQDADAEGPQDQ